MAKPPFLLIFGAGFVGQRLGAALAGQGWRVVGTKRAPGPVASPFPIVAFDYENLPNLVEQATHVLSTVKPDPDGQDPVLRRFGSALRAARPAVVYLSSTGVYGDTGGAWVDEAAALQPGRRTARIQAEAAWQALGLEVTVLRLPGIYGPGRSALERVRAGTANRVDLPGHVISRVHVDDVAGAIERAFAQPESAVYNVADDEPAPGRAVIEYACDLLALDYPPLRAPNDPALTDMARGFYEQCRRVSNSKIKRVLGWQPRYPSYREGLRACLQETQ
jgi:nucleoside-diphosphate-sugar epimerase